MTHSSEELGGRSNWNAIVFRLSVGSCIALGTLHSPAASVPLPLSATSQAAVNITLSVRPVFEVRQLAGPIGETRFCISSNLGRASLLPRLRLELRSGGPLAEPTYLSFQRCGAAVESGGDVSYSRAELMIVEAQ